MRKGLRLIVVLVQRLCEHQKKAPMEGKGSMGVKREVIEERTKTNCGACPETK